MSLPYFPMYPADFEADTSHLTLEEDGAYNRLLRLCWMTPGCSVPDDPKWVARRMRVDAETYSRVVAPLIEEFFRRDGKGRLFSPRLLSIWQETDVKHKRRVEAGRKGGRPRKSLETNDSVQSNAKAMPKQPEPEPEPKRAVETNVSTGAIAPIDPVAVIFRQGLAFLMAGGVKETPARSLLGKWKKQHGAEAVIVALGKAQREGAMNPAAFIEKALQQGERTLRGSPRLAIVGGKKGEMTDMGWISYE
jgi:uncharacterized protein YdaU (DUF1376 family)